MAKARSKWGFGRRKENVLYTNAQGTAIAREQMVGETPQDTDTSKMQSKSADVAAGVHGLTGAAFQKIPYTPKQVAEMEQRGEKRVAEFEKSLKPTLAKIDQLDKELRANRDGYHGFAAQDAPRRVIHNFMNVPNSGVTETQYNEAKRDLDRMEAEDKERGRRSEALDSEIMQLRQSVETQRAALRQELIRDPEVRYTETVNDVKFRQHIDVTGKFGGMVGDGVNADPEALIDETSTVQGKGLNIASGAQIINSDVSFGHGRDRPGSPDFVFRRNTVASREDRRRARVNPLTGKMYIPGTPGSAGQTVTVKNTVADSVVTWGLDYNENGHGTGRSLVQVVRPKEEIRREHQRRTQGLRDITGY
jgi:hypothetical protein